MKIRGQNVQPVFIIGHGRSGTNHLGRMMGKHEDVWATIEHPGYLFGRLNESIFNPDKRYAIPRIFEEKKQFLRNETVWESMDNPFWLDKSNQMVLIQDIIETYWPEALMLHVIRNPFDVYCSAKRHYMMSWFKRVNEVFGKGNNKYLGTNSEIEAKYDKLSLAEKMAYKWKSWIECGLWWQRTSDKVYTLTYEEMTLNPEKTFENIKKFLKLREDNKWIEFIRSITHSRSVGRYKRDMKQSEVDEMKGVLSDFLNSSDSLLQYRLID